MYNLKIFVTLLVSVVLSAMLSACASAKKPGETPVRMVLPRLELGQAPDGSKILVGGFSSLVFEGRDPLTGRLRFLTNTDRGPNGLPHLYKGGAREVRPFLIPDFRLQWIRVEGDLKDRSLKIVDRIPLSSKTGAPIRGLPNVPGTFGRPGEDEIPVGPNSDVVLKADPKGLDLEGLCQAVDGTYWQADEYRPSIVHFDEKGRMIERFVPKGTARRCSDCGIELLPKIYEQRRPNRGFEGVACYGNSVFAFLQSALDNPPSEKNANSMKSRVLRVLELNTRTKKLSGEYLFLFDDDKPDKKLGDALSVGGRKFWFIEQTSTRGEETRKKVFELDFSAATNVLGRNEIWEAMTENDLRAKGVNLASKDLVVNLHKVGFDFAEKAEGLARLDDGSLAVIVDNDFGVANPDDTAIFVVPKSLLKR